MFILYDDCMKTRITKVSLEITNRVFVIIVNHRAIMIKLPFIPLNKPLGKQSFGLNGKCM